MIITKNINLCYNVIIRRVITLRKVELTLNEQSKYEIVKQFVDSKSTNFKALSVKLGSSLKTAYNLVKKYHELGKEGFRHKNHDHKPIRTKPDELKHAILELYHSIGLDTNFTHFKTIIKRDYDICVSYNFLHQLFAKEELYSPKCQRKTRRIRNQKIKDKQKMKQPLTEPEKQLAADHLLDDVNAHPRKERAKYFGELVQMDASVHHWFGKYKAYLHAAIDDCTGRILGLFFDAQETLYGYYRLTEQILLNHGIPAQILTDNRTVFNYQKEKRPTEEKDTFTQYGFACHRLGIALYTSSIPQVKGRIERLFQTLQSRLIVELRLKGIDSIEKANEFIKSYQNEFNEEFALPYNHTIDAFEKQINCDTINETLAIVSHRTVDNGSTIKYHNSYYKFFDSYGHQMNIIPKTKCLVVKKLDGELISIINDRSYHLEEFQIHNMHSILEPIILKPRKVYHPPLSHPYKKASYDNYLKHYRQKLQNNYAYVA